MAKFIPPNVADDLLNDEALKAYFELRLIGNTFAETIINVCNSLEMLNPDFKNDKSILGYLTDFFLMLELSQRETQLAHLPNGERQDLIDCQSDYINANICLIGYMMGNPKSISQETAFKALRITTWAMLKIGNFAPTDASSNLLQAASAARARTSEKAVELRTHDAERRARAKDELRKMWGSGISNSDKAARIVQPKLQQRLGVEIDPEAFPKPSTIRKLIGELAAEQSNQDMLGKRNPF